MVRRRRLFCVFVCYCCCKCCQPNVLLLLVILAFSCIAVDTIIVVVVFSSFPSTFSCSIFSIRYFCGKRFAVTNIKVV